MKGKFYISGLMVLLTLPLLSCGGGDVGAPGSSGSSDTGIVIQSVSIVGIPTTTDLTPRIDANVHLCSDGKPEAGLFAVDAEMTIVAKKLNESTLAIPPFPAKVDVCTITYLRTIEDPSAPIIPSWTIYPSSCILKEGESKCTVFLIDEYRKGVFWNAIVSGVNVPSERPTKYVALYNCRYNNEFGIGSLEATYHFSIYDYQTCTN